MNHFVLSQLQLNQIETEIKKNFKVVGSIDLVFQANIENE